MNDLVLRGYARLTMLRLKLQEVSERGLDMRSRSGNDSALWDILKISLVATVASLVLFVLGPRLITLGQAAVNRVQAPPW